jgi:hypothetical protein
MAASLGDRLAAARARAFAGRAAEVELFRQALAAEDPPFSVLWLHGPGGVGKSTLLRRLADEAVAAGRTPVLLDARALDRTPPGLAAALGDAAPEPGRVVLLDTAELLAPLEEELRTRALPALPAGTLVVVGGRTPPSPAWRADPGWQGELRQVALRNLDRDDALAYLRARGVPDGTTEAVLRFTHGHPLALALIADVVSQRAAAARDLSPAEVADVLPALLERFVTDVPDPAHRTALEVMAHARQTTEALLRAVVGPDRAAECFAWLRGLSFVESGPHGLFPHDLAREVLDEDLRWRDPEAWRGLYRAVRAHVIDRIADASGAELALANADLIYLHRRSPALRPYVAFDAVPTVWPEPATADDLPAILELAARHEGERSAAWHRAWFEAQPAAFTALRTAHRRLHGFCVTLRLDGAPAGPPDDPFAAAAREHVARTAPLRRGQHASVLRSWMGVDGHHRPGATWAAVATVCNAVWLSRPGLAVSVLYMSDPAAWTPMFAHIDHAHAPDAGVELGGRRFGAFVHDWRTTPPAAWLDLMEPRELEPDAAALATAQRHLRSAPVLALGRSDFEGHLRDALRAACRPADLARSPLLRSGLVAAGGGADGATAADLRAVLERGVAALAADPATARYAAVLEVTHLRRVTTQAAAAARLSLPFSTYRRHLRAGTEALADVLWEWEIHGEMTPSDPVVP